MILDELLQFLWRCLLGTSSLSYLPGCFFVCHICMSFFADKIKSLFLLAPNTFSPLGSTATTWVWSPQIHIYGKRLCRPYTVDNINLLIWKFNHWQVTFFVFVNWQMIESYIGPHMLKWCCFVVYCKEKERRIASSQSSLEPHATPLHLCSDSLYCWE